MWWIQLALYLGKATGIGVDFVMSRSVISVMVGLESGSYGEQDVLGNLTSA